VVVEERMGQRCKRKRTMYVDSLLKLRIQGCEHSHFVRTIAG
jgi:hypothetical protein